MFDFIYFMKKSEFIILTDETKVNSLGVTLYRIKCIKDFIHAKEGQLGGWVVHENNVFDEGQAEVFGDTEVKC